MVRVEFHDKDNITTMKIEGRFIGHFAEDARSLVARNKTPGKLMVDLTGLSWTDDVGEAALSWLGKLGCKFVAGNTYSSYVCEKLKLRVIPEAEAHLASAT